MPKESIPTVTLPEKPVKDVCALQQSAHQTCSRLLYFCFFMVLRIQVSLN